MQVLAFGGGTYCRYVEKEIKLLAYINCPLFTGKVFTFFLK